jgi:hypothetical protein
MCPYAIVGGDPVKSGRKCGRAKYDVPNAIFFAGIRHFTFDALSRA